MAKFLPLFLVGGAGLAAAALAFGSDDAQAATPGRTPGPVPKKGQKPPPGTVPVVTQPTPELLGRIASAVASGDTAVMRALAKELRKMGLDAQAKDLERAAQEIETERAKAEERARKSRGLPDFSIQPTPTRPKKKRKRVPVPAPEPAPRPPRVVTPPVKSIPLPPVKPPRVEFPKPPPPAPKPPAIPPPPPLNPRKQLAVMAAEHLSQATKGSEDKGLVKTYQAQEGLKPSGFYGPGTGLSFIKYDIVPPKPFYFPSRNTANSKANYRKNLLFQATKDPARASEWQAAAIV